MHYSVEDQTPSLAHLSNRFYAKVTIHFYVPPKKFILRSLDACTEKALDKFAVEIKERIREKRFTSTGRRSGAAGNGGPAPPPRKGPPCDAEKVFNVMPSIEEIFPSRFNKAGKLNLLEMPVRDQRTLNQRPHYYV
ncbi:hypothetical protein Sste5346_006758 [Sporothrix stenoceras]|uniref:Uncharacterized protein n=1 Tax=Sporothrix stenoceras TaxID=5173 RepID=A0ABR3YXR2_9PEZI